MTDTAKGFQDFTREEALLTFRNLKCKVCDKEIVV